MSVRGTTHAIMQKKIINHDQGSFLLCAWEECDKDACSLYEIRCHEHARTIPCDHGRHITYAFCTERHKQYWLYCTGPNAHEAAARNNGRIMGMLPEGMRRSL